MDDYHDDPTWLTRTQLATFIKSRVDYHEQFVTKLMDRPKPSSEMAEGDIIHACLLDGGDIDSIVAVYTSDYLKSNGTLKPGAEKAFQEANPGLICLKEQAVEPLRQCIDKVMRTELGDVIRAASGTEKHFRAVVGGRQCECRTDIVCEYPDRVDIWDLKCGTEDDHGLFRRNARRLRYWLQDAHYSAVVSAFHDGKPVRFQFARQELRYPFRLKPYWYDPASRDEARATHLHHLREFVKCEQTGVWEDQHDPILVMDQWEAPDMDLIGAEVIDHE